MVWVETAGHLAFPVCPSGQTRRFLLIVLRHAPRGLALCMREARAYQPVGIGGHVNPAPLCLAMHSFSRGSLASGRAGIASRVCCIQMARIASASASVMTNMAGEYDRGIGHQAPNLWRRHVAVVGAGGLAFHHHGLVAEHQRQGRRRSHLRWRGEGGTSGMPRMVAKNIQKGRDGAPGLCRAA
jgi:hypothetical protein